MFKLEIKTENEAFEESGQEIARILRRLADRVEDGLNQFDTFGLADANGNIVGEAQYERPEESA